MYNFCISFLFVTHQVMFVTHQATSSSGRYSNDQICHRGRRRLIHYFYRIHISMFRFLSHSWLHLSQICDIYVVSLFFFLRNVLDMMAIRRVSDTQDLPFRKCVGWATGHSCSSSKWQLPEQCCDRYHSAITSQHSGPSLLLWTICDTVLRFLVAVVLMTRLSFAREGEEHSCSKEIPQISSRRKLDGWTPHGTEFCENKDWIRTKSTSIIYDCVGFEDGSRLVGQ